MGACQKRRHNSKESRGTKGVDQKLPASRAARLKGASLPEPPAPYESHLVCEFFRQAGRFEVARLYEEQLRTKARELLEAAILTRRVSPDLRELLASEQQLLEGSWPTLVGNAQNPLDHLVGDVLGGTEHSRYFIIEFKRYPQGFVDEVSLIGGKPDRTALLDHLTLDAVCLRLSRLGHFGAYWNRGEIILGEYYDLAFNNSTERSFRLPKFFLSLPSPNFAWSNTQLRNYIKCMNDHGTDLTTDDGHVAFGYIDENARFVAMMGTGKIFAMIRRAFDRAEAMRQTQDPQEQASMTSFPRPSKGG
jgi:hypothetical protein